MQSSFFPPAFCLALALSVAGCSSERVASGPTQPREQEVLRLRTRNPDRLPVVFGQVQLLDNTGRYPLPTALVAVDGQAAYTNEKGNYQLVLAPGSHQFVVGQTGTHQARTSLRVERGDSVRVNFYLRPD